MNDIDQLSTQLFEEAKRFLEKASEPSQDSTAFIAFTHAALLLGFSSLEAHLNAVAEELLMRPGLSVLDRSVLSECEFGLIDGRFQTKKGLKMYRLDDRITHILANFSTSVTPVPTADSWWGNLRNGIALRNQLVHPKKGLEIKIDAVSAALNAILGCLDTLYQQVYSRPFPVRNRGLNSTLAF
ncbi:MAG: hypothetical protein ABI351_07295 [Herbaspirillum sp.]